MPIYIILKNYKNIISKVYYNSLNLALFHSIFNVPGKSRWDTCFPRPQANAKWKAEPTIMPCESATILIIPGRLTSWQPQVPQLLEPSRVDAHRAHTAHLKKRRKVQIHGTCHFVRIRCYNKDNSALFPTSSLHNP
jgi:hypothetical protein